MSLYQMFMKGFSARTAARKSGLTERQVDQAYREFQYERGWR
jgi:hypothetical protein